MPGHLEFDHDPAPAPRRAANRLVIAVAAVAALLSATFASVATATPVSTAKTDHGGSSAAPTPASSPLAIPALPKSSTYARQVLAALYGGKPTRDEIVTVGTALDAGQPSGTMAYSLVRTDRWVAPRVDAIYRSLLDRRPTRAERSRWVLRVVGGQRIERVAIALADQIGGSNPHVVDHLYELILDRHPSRFERRHAVAELRAGAEPSDLAAELYRSDEAIRRLVDESYQGYVGRPANAYDLVAWALFLKIDAIGELDLAAAGVALPETRSSGCGLDERACLLPFPSDAYTVPDSSTGTGRRVAFKPEWMPTNRSGTGIDPVELNRNDGFSPGQAIVLRVPGVDLAATGAAPVNDIGKSLAADAPIVLLDADTGERWPYFAELDANIPAASQDTDQVLYVRPARNYTAGHRYIVAFRNLKDARGATIAAPDGFGRYRDRLQGLPVAGFEARRPHVESVLKTLRRNGVKRADLYEAWDFTVASTANTTGRMLHIRDDALASLDGKAPAFTVTSVTDDPSAGIARQVDGTYQVPLYLTGTGATGSTFATGADGLPSRNGTFTARFRCFVPTESFTTPARPVIYGHGLFGSLNEVGSSPQRAMVTGHGMVYCGTDWIGMANEDVPTAIAFLTDLSKFPALADRVQQGILNTVFLGRLLLTPDGFASSPAFQNATGESVIDPAGLFYDGNSQGGIIGGAYVAVSPDTDAGVLGVTGMNYSTLLDRSKDFDTFNAVYTPSYPDAVNRLLGINLIQMLWDRAEANGYAANLTDDPLPNTPPHRVLLHTAIGDQQVAPLTAEVEARTAGMSVHRPAYQPGRTLDVEPMWGLPSATNGSRESALVIWDSGMALAPLTNTPPRVGDDSHEDPRREPKGQAQKDEFLRVDGTFVDTCEGQPCTSLHRG